jgi:hypothetical protein
MLRPLIAALALALLPLGLGCSTPPPRSANPTKPVPERRALEIIGRAVRKKKMTPVEGHEITTQLGGKLRADVILQERKWGIAFLTANDLTQDNAEPLPKKDPKRPNALVVVDAVNKEDAGLKVLVLFERDYLYDDQVGEDHEQTMITAESAIERDVTDFLVQAGVQGWELPKNHASPLQPPRPSPRCRSPCLPPRQALGLLRLCRPPPRHPSRRHPRCPPRPLARPRLSPCPLALRHLPRRRHRCRPSPRPLWPGPGFLTQLGKNLPFAEIC